MGPPPYQGFFINLDRSADRCAAMLRQLEALGLTERYRRYTAMDGRGLAAGAIRPAELGCFLSHAGVLDQAAPGCPLHVLEDDALLSPLMAPYLDSLLDGGSLNDFDLILTEARVAARRENIRFFRSLFDNWEATTALSLVDASRIDFAGLTSYLVSASAIGKLQEIYSSELWAGPRLPVDLFIREIVRLGHLRAAIAMPFVTSIHLDSAESSTINATPAAIRAPDLLMRQAFFVGRDLEKLAAVLSELLGQPVPSAELMDRLTEVVTSPDRTPF
jgi:GR25 family glycosyltransferase involved in LPS biosynthesis